MRLTNRLLSVVLAAALAVAGAVIAVEIALAGLSAHYWVLPWPRWHRWALDHSPTATPVEVTCWVLAVAGLILLVVGLARYRPIALAAQPYSPDVTASIRRSSLERSLQRTSQEVDGIAGAAVKVARHKIRVTARSRRRDTTGLKDAVSQSVSSRLTTLHLAEQPELRVRIVSRSR